MKKLLLVFTAGAFLLSCSPKTAEIVETTTDETSSEGDMPKADIGEGKVVFLKNCTSCHYAKDIKSYTNDQWANILPRMVKKAELDDVQERQVTAYINWEISNE